MIYPMEGKVRNALLLSFAVLMTILPCSSPLPRRSRTNPDSATSLTAPLFHVDELVSPSATPEQRLRDRLRRDSLRVKALSTSGLGCDAAEAARDEGFGGYAEPVGDGSGEYYARLNVGTPPKEVKMMLDTGSDLVWLKCSLCATCLDGSKELFYANKSQTFDLMRCRHSTPCGGAFSCGLYRVCQYEQSYGDGSCTKGYASTETLKFGSLTFTRLMLGCSYFYQGPGLDGVDGMLGLGRGGVSFSSQTRSRFNGKFSYCLADPNNASPKRSTVDFGGAAVPGNAVFTPMLTNSDHPSYYFVELLGISVAGTRVPGVDASLFRTNGNSGGVIVDSGTALTRLPELAYARVLGALQAASPGLKFISAGEDTYHLDTCFNLTETKTPAMVLHFRDADVALQQENCRFQLKDDMWCFAFKLNEKKSPSVIVGNVQQQGIRIVYDLDASRVGFAPNACA